MRRSVPLLVQLKAAQLPAPMTEQRFHDTRKWRADLLWLTPRKLIVEIDGGTFIRGRHVTGMGYERDCDKLNSAVCLGFKVLRVTPRMIQDGRALMFIEQALKG